MKKTLDTSVVTFEMCEAFRGANNMHSGLRAALEAAPGVKAEPVGWIRAIDEALVCHHIDVANANDSYEVAKDKLNKLLCINQDIHDYFKKSDVVERIRALPVVAVEHDVDIVPLVRLDDVIGIIEGAK